VTDYATLNITQLTERLWTGGDLPEPLGVAEPHARAWIDVGIDHVIDCRHEWSDEDLLQVVAPHVRYTHIGIDDAGQQVPGAWFDLVTTAARETLREGGTVLVHCHMGINRGPSGAFATLLDSGWDPVEAIDLIRSARPIAAVGYAEDALEWWHHRQGMPSSERIVQRNRLRRWRRDHPHDTVRIIRQIRAAECLR
jgi:protein-tyrosine phosphatase